MRNKRFNIKKVSIFLLIILITYSLIPTSLPYAIPIWILILLTFGALRKFDLSILNRSIPYILFYSTSILTFSGFMNVLTGLDAGVINSSGYLWGFSFFSLCLAYYFTKNIKYNFLDLIWIIQPIRFFTGPIISSTNFSLSRFSINRFRSSCTWIILGAFFIFVLAPSIKLFQGLKLSFNLYDVIVFSTMFELYVYLNFAGASFIVMGILRAMGVNCVNNFQTPFSSNNIIDFWQRWHISLGNLCKLLFFAPLKSRAGINIAILITFLSSAMWHGVTLNFFLWGSFHSIMWISTYHLLKHDRKFYAYLLFPFVIIFGRLLFSESNSLILFSKIYSIFTLNTEPNSLLLSGINYGFTNLFLIMLSLGTIMLEIFYHRKIYNYNFYRKGWMPILLLLFILLFAVDDTTIIYGAR